MEESKEIKHRVCYPIDIYNTFVAECMQCHFHFFTRKMEFIVCNNCKSTNFQIYELRPSYLINYDKL